MSAFAAVAAVAAAAAAVVTAATGGPLGETRIARVLLAVCGVLLLASLVPGTAPAVVACAVALLAPGPGTATVAALTALLASLSARAATPPWVAVPLAAAAALAASEAWRHVAARVDRALVAGGLTLALAVAALDGGSVLRWSFGLGEGAERLPLPGAGLLLGLTLLAALGGACLLAADLWLAHGRPAAPSGAVDSPGRVWARRTLVVAAALGVLGLALTLSRAADQAGAAASWGTGMAAVAAAEMLLLCAAAAFLAQAPVPAPQDSWLRLAATLATLAALGAGATGWWATGTYLTPRFAHALAAAVLGVGAVHPTRAAGLRVSLFALALLALLT